MIRLEPRLEVTDKKSILIIRSEDIYLAQGHCHLDFLVYKICIYLFAGYDI